MKLYAASLTVLPLLAASLGQAAPAGGETTAPAARRDGLELVAIDVPRLPDPVRTRLDATAVDGSAEAGEGSNAAVSRGVSATAIDEAGAEGAADVTEEVVVIGTRTRAALRAQVRDAEDRVFALFNELNDDDDYDIHCRIWERTGTLIGRRVCWANFVGKATTNEATATLNFLKGEMGSVAERTTSVFRYKSRILRDKLRATIGENPELLEAVARHNALRRELDEAPRRVADPAR
ncbi:hypothetical protein [Candidatus Rariloculus sp.]|uniref:hypothetical protein n=1 Tax=Candidatus Rariloculus sp. TaxID=3101265 RepID=UPI003D104883